MSPTCIKFLVSYAVPRFARSPQIKDTVLTAWRSDDAPSESDIEFFRGALFQKEKTNCAIVAITRLES